MSDVMPEFTSVHLNQISDTAPTPPHFFQEFPNHWCLFFLCTGTATFFVSGGTYAVGGGDILLCPPGLCHAVIPSGNSHSVLLVFRTTPPCTGLTSCRLFSVRSHPDILSILRVIQNPSILMPAKDRLLAALLLQLDTLPGLVIDPLHPASQPSRILAHLNAHFREELSLTDLSDQFHLTPSHIIHIFNPLYGLSPIQYLNQRRIGEAQFLLRTTDDNAGHIAGRVGIFNRNHFYNTFKRLVGLSPGEYRRVMRDWNDR